ncbi:MAG: transporter [Microvirga sp.]|jgi:MFS family permease|nr:transporter [Microvirga sp.]
MNPQTTVDRNAADTPYAWLRLALSLLASTIGGIGMWSVVVVLPAVQAEFGVARGEASLPYTMTMLGFAFGGVLMGSCADRFGVAATSAVGAVALGLGYVGAAHAGSIWQFALIQGVLIGFLGSSATFAPLVADISHWFIRRRGIAVAICASGNYLSGTLWPPVLQHFVESAGWRPTHIGVGLFCVATLLPLSLAFRRQPAEKHAPAPLSVETQPRPVSPALVQGLLIVAGFACCVAMSMPQVHIVAYCGDLGYGVARGTEMLSIMLGLGIVSRVGSGFLADRIGGLPTVIVGSAGQALSLLLYLFFDGLSSLYVISAIFGLVQGGIIPSYAIVVREHFPAREAGSRVGIVIMATIVGMAFGGWVSGAIFDLTGSYRAAFLNGVAWNVLNLMVVLWLLQRTRAEPRAARAALAERA